MRLKVLVWITLLLGVAGGKATALSFTETTDLPGSAAFPPDGVFIGVLEEGVNTISGSLDGSCGPQFGQFHCNQFLPGEDTQDSFNLAVAAGFEITSIFVTTSNAFGPLEYSADLSAQTASSTFFHESLLLPGTTWNLAHTPLGEGIYTMILFGQLASDAGPYAFDYLLEINLSGTPLAPSPVPEPATVWLFGTGLVGVVLYRYRGRVAA